MLLRKKDRKRDRESKGKREGELLSKLDIANLTGDKDLDLDLCSLLLLLWNDWRERLASWVSLKERRNWVGDMLRRMSLATVGLKDRPPVVIAILHHISALEKGEQFQKSTHNHVCLDSFVDVCNIFKKIGRQKSHQCWSHDIYNKIVVFTLNRVASWRIWSHSIKWKVTCSTSELWVCQGIRFLALKDITSYMLTYI